jgi:hypothetical protein
VCASIKAASRGTLSGLRPTIRAASAIDGGGAIDAVGFRPRQLAIVERQNCGFTRPDTGSESRGMYLYVKHDELPAMVTMGLGGAA